MGVPTPNYHKVEVPGGFESVDRNVYLKNIQGNNQMADAMAQGIHGPNALPYLEAQNQYSMMSDMQKAAMDRTLRGRLALQGDLIRQSQMTSGGGGVPSEAMMSRFGFGPQGPPTNAMNNELDMLRRQQAHKEWQEYLDRTRPAGE
jgi:hypothetical protein